MADIIKVFRHYVPICPRCESPYTGRFVLDDVKKQIEITENYLKKGERVEVISASFLPFHNCFCADCCFEWHEKVPLKMYGRKEWKKICEITGTIEEAKWFQKEKYNTNKQSNLSKRKRNTKKLKNGLKISAFLLFGIDFNHLPFQEVVDGFREVPKKKETTKETSV